MDNDHDDKPPPLFYHRRTSYDFNNKIMLTAIISLSVIIILVTLLHIYVRYVLQRQARRRAAALRHLGIITAAHIQSVEQPKIGLDPLVIASIPTFVFRQTELNGGSAMECSVCLSVLEEGEMVRPLPNCKHTFHAECIDKWLGSNRTCPICRSEAEPRQQQLVPELRDGVAVAHPTAPSLEGTSDDGAAMASIQSSAKINASSSRLSSFRRMLTRERSSRRIQPHGQEDGTDQDLERQ